MNAAPALVQPAVAAPSNPGNIASIVYQFSTQYILQSYIELVADVRDVDPNLAQASSTGLLQVIKYHLQDVFEPAITLCAANVPHAQFSAPMTAAVTNRNHLRALFLQFQARGFAILVVAGQNIPARSPVELLAETIANSQNQLTFSK